MRQYAEENDIMSAPRRMLVGSFRGDKFLLATPLLRWYLAHGLVVDRVYQVVEYEPNPCFQRVGESVSAARRAGDSDPEKAIIADTMKIPGMGRRSPTSIDITMSSIVLRSAHGAHQQQAVPPTGCCDRRRIRDRDEQESREVHPSPPHRFLRLAVRQTPHAAILL